MWVTNYFPPTTLFSQTKRLKPFTALSLFPWKVLIWTTFITSTSSNLHGQRHTMQCTLYQTTVIYSSELLLCGIYSREDASLLATILIYSKSRVNRYLPRHICINCTSYTVTLYLKWVPGLVQGDYHCENITFSFHIDMIFKLYLHAGWNSFLILIFMLHLIKKGPYVLCK